jgi:hypothetical protein
MIGIGFDRILRTGEIGSLFQTIDFEREGGSSLLPRSFDLRSIFTQGINVGSTDGFYLKGELLSFIAGIRDGDV